MKKLATIVLAIMATLPATARADRGGRFTIRKEHNTISGDFRFNITKPTPNRVMFGDRNAYIEFCVEPYFNDIYGFRIDRDTASNKCHIEIKQIDNRSAAEIMLQLKYPEQAKRPSIPYRKWEKIERHNKEMQKLKRNARNLMYNARYTATGTISDSLAILLHDTIKKSIRNLRATGHPDVKNGETVRFRIIVGDEQWMLEYLEPRGAIATLADICKQLIVGVEQGRIDESSIINKLQILQP